MKNQWTTISEKIDAAHQKAREIASHQEENPRSRKIPIIFGSLGVFLMLVGASPFLFGNEDTSSRYLADVLNQEDEIDIAIDSLPAEEDFDLDIGLPTEDEEDIDTQEAQEVEVSLDGIPLQKGETQGGSDFVAEEVEVVRENIHAAPPVEEEGTREDIKEVKITSELVDFPKNTHTGVESEAVDLENFFKNTEDDFDGLHAAAQEDSESLHTAASQENAETGTPLLPLLAASGIAAVFLRRRKK